MTYECGRRSFWVRYKYGVINIGVYMNKTNIPINKTLIKIIRKKTKIVRKNFNSIIYL